VFIDPYLYYGEEEGVYIPQDAPDVTIIH